MQSVLALLKGRRVSLGVAEQVSSPKGFLTMSAIRTYMQWYARKLKLGDKEK
jgi:hypothetical protein